MGSSEQHCPRRAQSGRKEGVLEGRVRTQFHHAPIWVEAGAQHAYEAELGGWTQLPGRVCTVSHGLGKADTAT